MTIECRVQQRFPVAVAFLSGTLDRSAASIDAVVTLRGVLADQPVALVLDLAQLQVIDGGSAWRGLAELARDARRWPGARPAIGDARPTVRRSLTAAAGQDVFEQFGSTDEAVAAVARLPVPAKTSVELPPSRDAPATSREVVARVCGEWNLTRWQRLAQLLTSELVTNAVVHASTVIWFTMRHLDGVLELAVRDRDPRLVRRPPRGPEGLPAGEPGRGLLLLETLADDWGCAPTGDGKVTWASIALHPAGQRS
jgi:anti-sigma regulatory factor (Ser/Thr protein kinase)